MNTDAIFTSFEGDYHLGVAALLNSAIRAGFKGDFHVFHRGQLPDWTSQFEKYTPDRFSISNVSLYFHRSSRSRHFGYDKPFQALEIFEQFDHVESLFYFDPDVVILSPWVFFGEWVTRGVGLVMDCNAPIVPFNHPWRFKWRELALSIAKPEDASGIEPFCANSGFFCLQRKHRGFLDVWKAITDRFEEAGGDTQAFHLDQRWQGVTGDQDLLAASTQAWDGPLSYVGPDGMGFNGHYWLLSHATERPKPWRRICIKEALKGHPPKRTVGMYLDCANGAVRTLSQLSHLVRSLDYRLGRGIGCYWRRP